MSRPLRILVTGSREWRDHDTIRHALLEALAEFATIGNPVLVHGKQVSKDPVTGELYGADWIAEQEWERIGDQLPHGPLDVDRHPADWKRYGKAAGPIRNRKMVEKGATVCLAFPLGKSSGTRGCMALAEAAGIPVRNFGDQDPTEDALTAIAVEADQLGLYEATAEPRWTR